jgi:hypothetical protein
MAHAPRKKVYMELPVEVVEKDKNLLRGTLNDGGAKLELIAPNGEIRLQPLVLSSRRPQNAGIDTLGETST